MPFTETNKLNRYENSPFSIVCNVLNTAVDDLSDINMELKDLRERSERLEQRNISLVRRLRETLRGVVEPEMKEQSTQSEVPDVCDVAIDCMNKATYVDVAISTDVEFRDMGTNHEQIYGSNLILESISMDYSVISPVSIDMDTVEQDNVEPQTIFEMINEPSLLANGIDTHSKENVTTEFIFPVEILDEVLKSPLEVKEIVNDLQFNKDLKESDIVKAVEVSHIAQDTQNSFTESIKCQFKDKLPTKIPQIDEIIVKPLPTVKVKTALIEKVKSATRSLDGVLKPVLLDNNVVTPLLINNTILKSVPTDKNATKTDIMDNNSLKSEVQDSNVVKTVVLDNKTVKTGHMDKKAAKPMVMDNKVIKKMVDDNKSVLSDNKVTKPVFLDNVNVKPVLVDKNILTEPPVTEFQSYSKADMLFYLEKYKISFLSFVQNNTSNMDISGGCKDLFRSLSKDSCESEKKRYKHKRTSGSHKSKDEEKICVIETKGVDENIRSSLYDDLDFNNHIPNTMSENDVVKVGGLNRLTKMCSNKAKMSLLKRTRDSKAKKVYENSWQSEISDLAITHDLLHPPSNDIDSEPKPEPPIKVVKETAFSQRMKNKYDKKYDVGRETKMVTTLPTVVKYDMSVADSPLFHGGDMKKNEVAGNKRMYKDIYRENDTTSEMNYNKEKEELLGIKEINICPFETKEIKDDIFTEKKKGDDKEMEKKSVVDDLLSTPIKKNKHSHKKIEDHRSKKTHSSKTKKKSVNKDKDLEEGEIM